MQQPEHPFVLLAIRAALCVGKFRRAVSGNMRHADFIGLYTTNSLTGVAECNACKALPPRGIAAGKFVESEFEHAYLYGGSAWKTPHLAWSEGLKGPNRSFLHQSLLLPLDVHAGSLTRMKLDDRVRKPVRKGLTGLVTRRATNARRVR